MKRVAIGDSITAGYGISPASESYINQFAFDNKAVSNASAGDMARVITNHVPAADQVNTIMIGTNDARIYKDDAAKMAYYEGFLRHILVWLSSPTLKKSRTSPTAVFTGTWGNPSGYTYGKHSSQPGAKYKETFNGDALYLGYLLHNSTAAQGEADVYVDGVKVGELNTYAPGVNTSLGNIFATACARFAGFGPGAHEVEVVVTSPSGKIFYIDYAAGSDDISAAKSLVSNVIRMSDARYTSFGIDDTVIDGYNSLIAALVSQMSGDGMDVTLVDNHAVIDRDTDLSDGVHPTIAGHAKLNASFAPLV